MTPRRLLAPARCCARLRRTLVLEVAHPPAVEALFGAATAGACPRADGRRAPPAAGGVVALLGPRAPACDEPFAVVVVPTHDPGADVECDRQG